MSSDRPGGSKPLPPPVTGLAKVDERRDAAAAEYSRQLASIELGALEELDDEPTPIAPIKLHDAPRPKPEPERAPPSREPSATRRPNLEPIGDEAHPPENRRIPTQPPGELDLLLERSVEPSEPPPSAAPQLGAAPQLELGAASPKPIIRQSPAPVRRGLFSIDRITNLLAGVAVGLLLSLIPAKKLAQSHETREVEPRLADLETAVTHTLAVDAGLVESPEQIAAQIHDGRRKTRKRFLLIWLLAGVPLGIGLGFAPRPWE